MVFDFIFYLLIAILSILLDNYHDYFNYSFTSLLLFMNIVALYIFLTKIEFTIQIRYNT